MDGTANLKCEIVTPEGLVFDGDAAMVIVPGEMGELGILPRHAPIVSRTVIGEVRLKHPDGNGEWEHLAVGSGYVKVQFDRLLLLVDNAERAVDIDVERVQASLHRAEELLGGAGGEGVDARRAELSRKRALNRLKVAGRS